MNFPPPEWVTNAATEALHTVVGNHYSHPKGRIRLRQAIKDFYSPLFTNLDRPLDIENEILVSSGANEGRHLRLYLKLLTKYHIKVNMLFGQLSWRKVMKLLCSNHSSTNTFRLLLSMLVYPYTFHFTLLPKMY